MIFGEGVKSEEAPLNYLLHQVDKLAYFCSRCEKTYP